MNRSDLDNELKAAIDGFASDVKAQFSEGSTPATHEDLLALARFTFYALDSIRDSVLKYIESSES